jgi:hypothetical protein
MTHILEEEKAWTVLVIRQEQRYSDYFAHAVYGGKRPALLAARRYRDELLQRIGPDSRERRRKPRGHEGSGPVVGVTVESYTVGGRLYRRYVAHWQSPEGRPRKRRFSVMRYGEEGAEARAIAAREAGVAETRAALLARQREAATRRLEKAAPMPPQVRDPLCRKGISMARRRPRRKR